MIRGNEKGFTLPELIVVTVVLVVLAGLATLLLSPVNQKNERLDAERRMGVAVIIQGINRYIAESSTLPPFLPDKQAGIGTSGEEYDVCLVTSLYLLKVPMDPVHGVVQDADGKEVATDAVDCDDTQTAYSTGYTIVQRDGKAVVGAGLSDGSTFTLSSAKPAKP